MQKTLEIPHYARRDVQLSVKILENNIQYIYNVEDWSAIIGYSRAHFCRIFTRAFGENPKFALRRVRFLALCRCIQTEWSITSGKAAELSGFKDHHAMQKFLYRNYQTGFKELKSYLKRDSIRARTRHSIAADTSISYKNGVPGSTNHSTFP